MKINQFDPYIGDEELSSLTEVLKNNWITEGEKTAQFEEMLKSYCNSKHVILLPNGTLALYVALSVLGVGSSDEVIVPAFTFVGSATSVVLTGAKPCFCDINRDYFNINIESLKSSISKNTKAIMPVHIYGQPANILEVMKIAKENNLKIIEDAAQCLGVTFGQKHVGTFGDIGCMSFYADKTITTAEGGAVFTDSDELAERCLYFKNQGRLRRGSFVHPQLGYNFRITDLQAALGVVQMKKLSFIINKKKENESLYKRLLDGIDEVSFPAVTKLGKRVPFRVNLLIQDPEALGKYLSDNEIGIRRFFYPLHKQPCFNDQNSRKPVTCKNSEYIFKQGLSLPSGVALNNKEIEYVCSKIRDFFAGTEK